MAAFFRLFSTLAALFVAASAQAGALPSLALQGLDGAGFSMPGDLRGDENAVVIGFTRKAGDGSKPWLDRLERDYGANPRFAAYSVAVLASVPPLFRPLALAGIRGSAAAAGPANKNILFTFSDGPEWKSLVGSGSADDPYVLIVDRRGIVAAAAKGPFTEAAYAELSDSLRRALESDK